jgi:hypothetical protein
VRTVKAVFTAGTTQPSEAGQPASVTGFLQSEEMALLICEGSTAPLSGSA